MRPRRLPPRTALAALAALALAPSCGGDPSSPGAETAASASAGAAGSAGASGAAGASTGGAGGAGVGAGGGGATAGTTNVTFRGDAWADNWFALYLGDTLVVEDSVPITTVKSFNAETFTFEAAYPFTLAFVLRDYIENDTGLEYIGTPEQKIGDGGFAFQLTDTGTGQVVRVSDESWRCLVVHKAPLDPSCAKSAQPSVDCQASLTPEPEGWRSATFDDAAWPLASTYPASAIGPKGGFADIAWSPSMKFIWSGDLLLDNTVLCRATVTAP